MFESQGRTMTRQKSIVIGAIAVSAMLLYALPAQNLASATVDEQEQEDFEQEQEGEQELAQRLVDETRQRIDQDARQRAEN
jgi:hypothetical protein